MKRELELPEGKDLNDWLALHTIDYYNICSMIYGEISNYCTQKSCPLMTAGKNYQYRWCDGNKYPNPVDLPACEYIGILMDCVSEQFHDEKIFPSQTSDPYPNNFETIVKNIIKRLFRIFSHIYYHHSEDLERIDRMVQFNYSLIHFIFFSKLFNLIPPKELAPLQDIVDKVIIGI